MSPNKFLVAGVMACAFLVAGCGSGKKNAPPKAAGTAFGAAEDGVTVADRVPSHAKGTPAAMMLALVPDKTIGLVYIPSLKKFGDGFERISDATTAGKGARARQTFSLTALVQQMGLELGDFDLSRPAAIAMTQPASAMSGPGVTAILPVRDERSVAAKLRALSPKLTIEAVDGFAVIVEKGVYRRAGLPAAMGAVFPEGDVVIRVDVASLWKTYGDQATSSMTRSLRSKGAGAVKPAVETLTSVLEAATICDVVLRIDGTELETDATLHFAEGAKVPALDAFTKSDLAALARAIPDEGMMSLAMAVNPRTLWGSVEPIATAALASSPAPARRVLQKALDSIASGLKALGGGMAVTGGVKDGRVELIGIVETADPVAYLNTLVEVTSSLPTDGTPVTVKPPEERTVEGTKVTTLRVKMESRKKPPAGSRTSPPSTREPMEAMFGGEPLIYNFVVLEKALVLVMGGDAVLERTIKACKAGGEAPPTALSKALAAAGPETVGYFRMDLGALMRETAAIAACAGASQKKPVTPAGDESVPLTLVLSSGKDQIRGRVSVDIGKLARIFMGVMPR